MDDAYLGLCASIQADYLITGDKDLLSVDPTRRSASLIGLRILIPGEFLEPAGFFWPVLFPSPPPHRLHGGYDGRERLLAGGGEGDDSRDPGEQEDENARGLSV